jgi:hypothetical protein
MEAWPIYANLIVDYHSPRYSCQFSIAKFIGSSSIPYDLCHTSGHLSPEPARLGSSFPSLAGQQDVLRL